MSATRAKDLWAGNPVWFSYNDPSVPYTDLPQDLHVDAVIVGGGISGATMAQTLSEQGYSTIILDKRPPGYGSTSASTALLQYDLDMPLTKLSQDIGEESAIRAWRRSKDGFDHLAQKIKRLGIPHDQQHALYLSGTSLDADEMRKEYEARIAIGLKTDYLTKAALKDSYGIDRPAALLIQDSLSVDPRELVATYLNSALSHGARIFSPVEMTDIIPQTDHVIIHTDRDFKILASFVVLATGYEVFKKINLKKKRIVSSWAIATRPQSTPLWPGKTHIWEASSPYLYIRATPDNRVLCGGEDEDFADEEKRNKLLPEKTHTLETKLAKLFPHLDCKADFAWTGCFGETDTSLPMIGPVPDMPNCYAILGFGGNGITFSHLAADILMQNIKGKTDPDQDLFQIK